MTTPASFRNVFLCSLVCVLSACVNTSPQPLRGVLYTDVMGPNQALPHNKMGAKKGEACSNNILSLVSWGDASIEAAKKDGHISSVATVDYRNFGVLAIIYNKTCTIVTGT